MLHAMRAWLLVLVGCGSAPPVVSNTGTAGPAPCGFTDFASLDAAAWEAARGYTYQVDRPAGTHGPKWPDGKPPPLGPPPAVGTCLLHAIDPLITRYVLRDGNRDIAQITLEGTLVLVPGIAIDGFAVGMSSDVVLERHPPDRFRISCMQTSLGSMCMFAPIGSETQPRSWFLVDGDAAQLEGIAAYEFFKHKPLRGVQQLTRM
jgi:hypothetical protein